MKGQRGEEKGLTLRDHITPEDWGKIAGLEKFEETEEDKSIVESCGVITSSSGGWLPPLRELDLPEIPPSPSGPRFRDKFREMEVRRIARKKKSLKEKPNKTRCSLLLSGTRLNVWP